MLDPSERAALRKKQKLLFDTGHLSVQGQRDLKKSKIGSIVRFTMMVVGLATLTAVLTYWLA